MMSMIVSMLKVLECLHRNKLTINLEKSQFGLTQIEFYGLVFGQEGMSVDPNRVQALLDMPDPESSSEVRSLLGMLNFSARFIPNFSSITYPLRTLTHKDAKFFWGPDQKSALDQLKAEFSKATKLAYFDTAKDTC